MARQPTINASRLTARNMSAVLSYTDWHIPLQDDQLTLNEAYLDLQRVSAGQDEIPLMVQLVENPKFKIKGFELFHGAVDLQQHDYIHILLGRGLLPRDEAFVIGYTMGSTKKVSTLEEDLFSTISRYLYPKVYQFSAADIAVFKDAVRLAYLSNCTPLDEWNFEPWKSQSLAALRAAVGIEYDLLLAYYQIEQKRYPDCKASQRLLTT
jgi:hypothetical protein